ncbi:MAG: DinB family protein [Gemmatimonadaceae bacterium]|nr:DinB family protein [Gemmatimonadaceae bacterium]
MSLAAGIIQELEQEAAATRRVLERIPAEHFDWKPHPKSRTLGQLAMHLATNPGGVTSVAMQNPVDLPNIVDTTPASTAELMAALDASMAEATTLLGGLSDAEITAHWIARAGGVEVLAMPRHVFLRAVLLNHWYHHRGQLTVYLRLLDVPVPSIYGPSADENPFI